MRHLSVLLFAPVVAFAMTHSTDTQACGGCFVSQSETTQVTGHRMILSVGSGQTTLYDQIEYSGAPSSFGWVLPIKGTVDVGLSSDALFANLEQWTAVSINSPQITCPPPPNCGSNDDAAGAPEGSSGTGPGGGEPPVEVLAQEVVGPYETVQLSSQDPAALKTWLSDHGYNVPDDILPVVDAYVQEGFNFLALKLVPGQGVDSMRPVRITTQGASPILPLRMVAAGTGAKTPISLWIVAEGRYEPGNFPSFTIPEDELVWNWTEESSNYAELRSAKIAESNGFAWHVEAAEPFSSVSLESNLLSLASYDPKGSGYGDENGLGAVEEAQADMDALFGGINRGTEWITHLVTELSRPALATDLEVGASADQSTLNRFIQVTKSEGKPPPCPQFEPCGGDDDFIGDSACSVSTDNGKASKSGVDLVMLVGLGLGLATFASRRRRR